jgi:hypothetical protein
MPQCDFKVRPARSDEVAVSATIDTAPQAYVRLERAAVEAGQRFSNTSVVAAPVSVAGLGLDAQWFPADAKLMTTDGARLITVVVSWPAANDARKRSLAESVARPYLEKRK